MTDFEQTSWIPKTELDEATAVLAHLLEERKAKAKSMGTAETNYEEACERVTQQQHVVDALQAQMPAAEPAPMEGEAEEADDVEDAEIVDDSRQIEGDTIDPETGEVTSRAERGEGTVRAWWPNADEPVVTEVGPTTQYAELVGDYTNAGDPDMASDQIEEYSVVAVGDGRTRELHSAIAPEDHGLEFVVVYGTAADHPELRACSNCGIYNSTCALKLPESERDIAGTGCGGNGWRAVPTDDEYEHDVNAEAEAQAQEVQAA